MMVTRFRLNRKTPPSLRFCDPAAIRITQSLGYLKFPAGDVFFDWGIRPSRKFLR
jgi:hypothetical protein